jgi:hypothetical protein
MSLIVHIVPQLPPAICGVGDYSLLIGRRIEELAPAERCGYVTCGFRAAKQPPESPVWRDATGCCDGARLWNAVDELVEEMAEGATDHMSLVVHLSGYGYDPKGAPGWLADALESQRPPQYSGTRILTMFHELYATGRPWQRAFWHSSRQREVAIRLARLSNAVMTNRQQSARWLEEMSQRPVGSVVSLPVTSNVGEPQSVPPWDQRPPRAVIFGGLHNKRFVVGKAATQSATLLEKLGIEELVDVGQPASISRAVFEKRGIRIEQLGYRPRECVSELLLQSRIGLIDYACDFLEKSGVLAALAAHGLAVFNADRPKSSPTDQLPVLSFSHAAGRTLPSARDLESAAGGARHWYWQHRSEEHARTILQLVAVPPNGVRS